MIFSKSRRLDLGEGMQVDLTPLTPLEYDELKRARAKRINISKLTKMRSVIGRESATEDEQAEALIASGLTASEMQDLQRTAIETRQICESHIVGWCGIQMVGDIGVTDLPFSSDNLQLFLAALPLKYAGRIADAIEYLTDNGVLPGEADLSKV